jgi:hypothetical protein
LHDILRDYGIILLLPVVSMILVFTDSLLVRMGITILLLIASAAFALLDKKYDQEIRKQFIHLKNKIVRG